MRDIFSRVLLFVSSSSLLTAQAAWSQLYPLASPSVRQDGVMASHDGTATTVMFSGATQATGGWGYASDCWLLHGSTWTAHPGPVPPSRLSAAMAYDSLRHVLVLFGGSGPTGALNDTWEWTGSAWVQRSPALSPSARWGHTMAFDPNRGQVVMFAGAQGGIGALLDEVWEFGGANWVQRTPSLRPLPRRNCSLAFDPAAGGVLMYGGLVQLAAGTIVTNDTWTWNGTDWTRHHPMTPPSSRSGALAVSDLARQRVVLHGGSPTDQFTWEWDGQEWSTRFQATPGVRQGHHMAYDATHRRVVLFAGHLAGWNQETWVYQTPSPAEVVAYGAGCMGTAGVPALSSDAAQLPWLGDTHANRLLGVPPAGGVVVFVTGLVATAPIPLGSFGMPGCEQLVQPAAVEFAAASGGAATWSLAIPGVPAFVGVQLFQQAVVLDPGANLGGMTTSNGLQMTIGMR